MTKMTGARALKILEITGPCTRDEVRSSFARFVRMNHPDNGGDGVGYIMAEGKAARDYLLDQLKAEENACKNCNGWGKVRGVMGWRPCDACDGSGDRR